MGIVKGKTTKAFRTCANKGFHLKFENGWSDAVEKKLKYMNKEDLKYWVEKAKEAKYQP